MAEEQIMSSATRVDMDQPGAASAKPHTRRAGGRRALSLLTAVVAPAAALLVPLVGTADSATESRYPFDPACPWGRLANGKGMITRCLGEDEARALLAGGTLTTKAGATVAVPGIADKQPATTPAGSAASRKPQEPTEPPASAAPSVSTSPAPARPVRVEVGPVVPEDGEVTIGQLGKPLDRYRACVEQHGGLTGNAGEVRVHFLVRGERSRAEGVEVSEFRGVTKKAAQCIADVVDRRATGTPSKPLVGATLVFKLSS